MPHSSAQNCFGVEEWVSSKKTFFDSNPSYGEPSHYFPAGEGSRLVRRWRNVRRLGAAARCASAFDDALPMMSASKVTGILGTEYMHYGSSWASCSAQSPSLPYEEGWSTLCRRRSVGSASGMYTTRQSRCIDHGRGV